ncbi:hypothetical protein [Dactylosporangium sp. NPDC051484]|uniref:hypothetical protein n=1 Tax=Dactylosporangium sp. NPDC051484 TaxID=3154942 RepID=UPI00344E83FB
MSKAFVVRYEMRPDSADENQRLIENVFAELAQKQPDGIRYASFRLDDGVTFVHVGISSDDSNALGETAAFQEFQKAFGERAATKPVASGAQVVGSYGFDR